MAKLHELLAAEKTPTGAWNQLLEETHKKFGNASHFFEGYTVSLAMIEQTPANAEMEAAAHEVKAVATTVYDTLEYALDLWGKAEDCQAQKNATNRLATGTVMWRGAPLLEGLPVDELLGLEARLKKIRELYVRIPTLDATKHWKLDPQAGAHIYVMEHPEEKTKTKKTLIPVQLSPATDHHPAQVAQVNEDVVVGRSTTERKSGAVSAYQKAEAIKRIDELLVEVKQARMRANETEVEKITVADKLLPLLLEPLKD